MPASCLTPDLGESRYCPTLDPWGRGDCPSSDILVLPHSRRCSEEHKQPHQALMYPETPVTVCTQVNQ